jgi:hypothetical protein
MDPTALFLAFSLLCFFALCALTEALFAALYGDETHD